ncbi:T-cell surface glycoprotein CD8 alpha chain isoform X2 [Etheostoma spectabile]|uniref:T-cell surface glycoprotein CD8 alpha chain isoform X2 n=1 Tax=Etheostoma spectabile TaxID=54343 RepID=UPI0013AF14ED|nr:T-cell surface glycoprotein CD8 alpha chain-like isoform X2 [Etheostoma spectabile]
MDQKWSQILVILVFCQRITSGVGEDRTVKEGEQVEITCIPQEVGSIVVWFRVLDTSGMEFIASFSSNGLLKSPAASFPSTFSQSKIQQNILTLKSFSKSRDSGVYNCASLKANELKFGVATRLVGEKVEVAVVETPSGRASAVTTEQNPCTTAAPCDCNNINKQGETSPQMFCTPIILGPLAGGCGLLLLILIITTVYCNHIRTRRCPHHYNRKPRSGAHEKLKVDNRHV